MCLNSRQVSHPCPSQWQLALFSLCSPWLHLLQQLQSQRDQLCVLVSSPPSCSLSLTYQVRFTLGSCNQQFSPCGCQLTSGKLPSFLFPLEMFCTRAPHLDCHHNIQEIPMLLPPAVWLLLATLLQPHPRHAYRNSGCTRLLSYNGAALCGVQTSGSSGKCRGTGSRHPRQQWA